MRISDSWAQTGHPAGIAGGRFPQVKGDIDDHVLLAADEPPAADLEQDAAHVDAVLPGGSLRMPQDGAVGGDPDRPDQLRGRPGVDHRHGQWDDLRGRLTNPALKRFQHFVVRTVDRNPCNVRNPKGTVLGIRKPGSQNFLSYWDGDTTRELLDGTHIDKYGTSADTRLLTGPTSTRTTAPSRRRRCPASCSDTGAKR